MEQFFVSLDKLARESHLTVAYTPKDLDQFKVYTAEVYRPGIMLAGYYQYFDRTRIQIIGLTELSYLNELDPEIRRTHLEKLFSFQPPAVILTRGFEPLPEMMEFAQKYGVPLLQSAEMTSPLMSSLIQALSTELAPRITRHGVLVEVYGEGILILGDSGVGKSETAIELVKRGHRLVADDAAVGLVVGRLELRLHQADEDGARLREPRERGRQGRQADEAQVGHQQVERRTQLGGIGQLDVGALEHRHARVLTQLPRQLPVVHVHARHAAGAGLQKAIGESARRTADVHAAHARDVLPERVERALQLMPSARNELLAPTHNDFRIGRHLHRSTRDVHIVHLYLMREHSAQNRACIRKNSLLNKEFVKAYLFRLFRHRGIIQTQYTNTSSFLYDTLHSCKVAGYPLSH